MPLAKMFDNRMFQSNPESRQRAGYDGAKCKRASNLGIALDTLGHLLTLRVTAASQQNPVQAEHLNGSRPRGDRARGDR